MKPKVIIIALVWCLSCLGVSAQETAAASGGEATGTGGTESYTVGQMLYYTSSDASTVDWLGVQQSFLNLWKGYQDTNWGTASNWLLGSVPVDGDNIVFDLNPAKHLELDQDRTVGNIVNNQSTYIPKINGHNLTLTGDLSFSNNAKLDAAATSSTLTLAGTATQNLSADLLFDNKVYNLTVNNANNVVLSGSLNLLNNITATTGKLDAYTQSPTIVYAGTTAQTVATNSLLDDKIYNIISDNAAGLTVNTVLTVQHDVTVNADKLMTIAPAQSLTVNGTLTNNAGTDGFIINSTADGTGALIHNTDNVSGTVNRYFSSTADALHFLSTPVAAQSISGDWKPTGTHPDNDGNKIKGYDLYLRDEPSMCWVSDMATTWATLHPTSYFVPGRGYLYALQATTATKQFVGSLNNGTITYPVTASATKLTGFNLVGNPYPSSIDWKNDNGFDRTMLMNNVGGYDIWIWNPTANNYGVYNTVYTSDVGTNGVTRYIAPMQGFFVKATTVGALGFKNAARFVNGASAWKVASKYQPSMLSVKVAADDNSLGSDEVLYHFDQTTDMAGAQKLFSSVKTAPSLYVVKADVQYSTLHLADSVGRRKLQVDFKAGIDGTYVLKCPATGDQITSVYVRDLETNDLINMTDSREYQFKAVATADASRFTVYINYIPQDADEIDAKVYAIPNCLIVDMSGMEGDYTSDIYDISGRVIIAKKQLVGNQIYSIPLQMSGVYMVNIYNNSRHKVYKVVYKAEFK